MRSIRALFVSAVLLVVAPFARAEPPATAGEKGDAAQQAAAEDLYQQGIALTNQGKWADAALKLEESNRIDRAPGTTLNLADCYARLGRLASAWSLFEEAAAIFGRRSPPDERASVAGERARVLFPRLARLTIDVREGARVPGLVIKRDDVELGKGQWGTGIPVDPGAHVVEAAAPGKQGWRATVEVKGEAANVTTVIPFLADVPSPTPAGRSQLPAFVLGGAGLAALITGGALVGVAVAQGEEIHDTAPRDADGLPICGRTPALGEVARCADLRSSAEAASVTGNVGIGLLGAGGGLAAAAVVYWLLPSGSDPAVSTTDRFFRVLPVLGQNGGGFVVRGSF